MKNKKTVERLPYGEKGTKIPQGHTSPCGMGMLNYKKNLSDPFRSGRMCDFDFY